MPKTCFFTIFKRKFSEICPKLLLNHNRPHHQPIKHLNTCLYSPNNMNLQQEPADAEHNLKVSPPESVRGIKVIDKKLFEKPIKVPSLKLENIKLSTIMPIIKKYLLKINNFKPIQQVDSQTLVYLHPDLLHTGWNDLSPDTIDQLRDLSVGEPQFEFRDFTLQYENFTAEVLLKSILPTDREGLSSFTKVGHIVHVNLREHLMEFKSVIGQILHDKVSNCRTVVNKVDSIDNMYRNFKMEVLRGDRDFMVQLKENKCVFEFDFSTVYWNSRLCTEHERIVNLIKPGSLVFDVFAGVGPFSVPLARKKCTVYANDLNPESYKYLIHNSKINKCGDNLRTFNKDGADFIKSDVKTNLPLLLRGDKQVYVIMNLPALALDFLHNFVGLFAGDPDLSNINNNCPIVIVYCFTKGENCEELAKKQLGDSVAEFTDFDITAHIMEIFRVRTVSSMKEMMRITFRLDWELLRYKSECSASKRRKLDECGSKTSKENE